MPDYHPALRSPRQRKTRVRATFEHLGDLLARWPRGLILGIGASAIILWGSSAWAFWVIYDVTERLPGQAELAGIGFMARATTVFDAADRPVFTFHKEQRIEVPLARVSPHLVQAVLAIEDQRFFEHRGIDLVRVAAAALANLRQGRAAQGGSTITQQLARASLLTREKTLRRKLKEIVLASRLEQTYSKEQILELYLNKVYFGDGLYGVEAAARGFLGKSAAELDVADSSLLAGLIKSPSAYAPTVNLERAIARRNLVLAAMREIDAVDQQTYDAARAADVTLRNGLEAEEQFGSYFKEQVRRELIDRFGIERVYEGGLRVFTTVDQGLQRAADGLVEAYVARVERQRGYPHPDRNAVLATRPEGDESAPDYLQGALVAIDPQTGHVRALVGGRTFEESHFNRAVQAHRQAGSAFKPFVYAAALESGFTPATILDRLDDPVLTPQGEWVPEDEHTEVAQMTLRTALRTSSNRAAVRLLQSVGIPRAVEYARRLNLGTQPGVPSLVLGSGTVTLLGMTTAYGAFANGGLVRPPILVRRVEDADGVLLYEAAPEARRAISQTTAFLLANMLADVVNAGTAYRARSDGFLLPAAGKTGTTNEYFDAWFIGFTPRLVAGVWMGFDQPKTIMRNGFAGELAVPLWAGFMKAATKRDKPVWLARPQGVVAVEVCRLSGQRPSDGCHAVEIPREDGGSDTQSMVYTEYFASGTEPLERCPLHGRRSFLDRIVDMFGGGPPPPESAPVAEAVAVPSFEPPPPEAPSETAILETPQAAEPIEPQPKRRRGFWSRLFGR